MTRLKAWFECSQRGCERETLITRAEAAGWFVGEGHLQLCPLHRRDRRPLDAAARAAGERDDDE